MKYIILTAFLLSLSGFAENNIKLSIDSEIFTGFEYTLSQVDTETGKKISKDHPSTFNLKRAYINLRGKIDNKFSARVTLDAAPKDGGQYNFFLKYSYLNYNITNSFFIRGGVIDNPFHSFINSTIWKHRYVENNYGASLKYWNSANSGIYVRYKDKAFDFAAGVNNGSGYKQNPDTDEYKDLFVYGNYFISNLIYLSGYFSYILGDEDIRFKSSILSALKLNNFLFGYNFLFEKNGDKKNSGHSFYLTSNFKKIGLHIKGIYWNEHSGEKNNQKDITGGISYSPIKKKLSFALSSKVSWINTNDKELLFMIDSVFRF